MLAYVFWHRSREGVDAGAYEEAQRAFHAALQTPSACFRLERLPFGDGEDGYEDWHLVDDWTAIGELNARAVDEARRPAHDQAASLAGAGWGAIYELARGIERIPEGVEWLEKPRGEPSEEFIASLPHESVWRRQLALGPGPEFCSSTTASDVRRRI